MTLLEVAKKATPTLVGPPGCEAPVRPAPRFVRDQVLDGNYRIVGELAAGGMGEVYVAAHLRLPRRLAIKTLQPEFASNQERVARFCREAYLLAQLDHPNIVQVLDFNVAPNGVPYIAMELIDGVDLCDELDRGRRLEIAEIVSIIRQVASALGAAHAAGIVHRDLKPDNVLLTRATGQLLVVKVIDFGLALREGTGRVSDDHTLSGTPDYMAPEQAHGRRCSMDARTDQFALAALAYTLLSGRTPFARETPVAVLHAVIHDEPAALGSVEGWDAAPVERVLRKGMARERDDRYASVLDFADNFEAALVDGGALPRPTTPEPLPLRLVPSTAPATSNRHARPSRSALRGRISALLISFGLAGALWAGRGRVPAVERWQRHVEAVRARASTALDYLRTSFYEGANVKANGGEHHRFP
jgi:serine/threonine-protein kinase